MFMLKEQWLADLYKALSLSLKNSFFLKQGFHISL